ncbi:MAG: hypothetical protein ABL984_19335 [Pyrinomonadaceae bacterium]
MPNFLRSKAGYVAAGIYLLITLPGIVAVAVFFVLRYFNGNADVHPIEEPISIGTVALTLPWSIVATLLGMVVHGGQGMHTGRLVIVIGLIVGAMINASIFYLLAYGVSTALSYLYELGNPRS